MWTKVHFQKNNLSLICSASVGFGQVLISVWINNVRYEAGWDKRKSLYFHLSMMEIITTLFQNKFPISFCEILLSSFPRYCSSFWNLILIIYKHFWNLLYGNDSYIWREECCWAVTTLFGTVLNNSKSNERESIRVSLHLMAIGDLAWAHPHQRAQINAIFSKAIQQNCCFFFKASNRPSWPHLKRWYGDII